MKFVKIEWKNIFAYGEEIQTVEYQDGELVLLKGKSGSGKTAILSLPSLLLYGKLEKLNKSAIANRLNKNGWIRGTIEKSNHTYIIERTFSPNTLTVIKDGVNIDSYGTSSAQDYIDKEIADIPLPVFSNMISISLKKFKSFLTMSPADRKQIIDRVFNLEAVNIAFEKIKKDGRDISAAINSDNSTLFQLGQTFQRATNELTALQEKFKNEVNKTEIEENNKKIQEITDNVTKLTTAYQEYSTAQQELTTKINDIKKRQYENNFNIKTIDEKLQLFSQAKCPTCGVSFVSESYTELKQKLADLKNAKNAITAELNNELNEVNTQYSNVNSYLTKINNTIYQYKSEISTLANKNKMLEEQFKSSAEFSSIQNIVNSTAEQMDAIKQQLSDNSLKLKDLQNLALVYSIDGVKQKVIINYLPILNDEIEHNLQLLNFPYQLDIDSKFEPHLKELGVELSPETLSDGEEARVDLVILCSLFKLLKRRFPTINILSIDEVISSLDSESSGLVLEFLKEYAKENNLSCFIVSHTDLFLDNFDKIIEVNKDGFSKINVFIPNV